MHLHEESLEHATKAISTQRESLLLQVKDAVTMGTTIIKYFKGNKIPGHLLAEEMNVRKVFICARIC